MRYPLDELLDKRSIIQLKIERINDDDERKRLIKEFSDYTLGIAEYIAEEICTEAQVKEWHEKLYVANGRIWDLEANIRKGQIGDMTLEEVGATAIKIREANGIRVGIKSEVVRAIGQGYEDIKINHASEKTLETYKSNPYLNQEYVEYLEGLEGDLGKAWREGDWDLFKGQVFSEWRNLKHVIEEPDYPLELCYKVVGFDWGYNNPGCAFWIAFTPDVRAYGYRELYQSGKNPQEWANQMKIFLQVEKVNEVVLPHDCFSHLGGNETIATIFEETWKDLGENRPFVVRGNTMGTVAVKNRITIFHQYLRDAPDGKPYFQVLSRCTNLIRTLPELIYSKINVEMIDKSGEDHSFDSASIALMRHVEMAMQSGAVKDSGPARVITPNFVSDEEGRIQGPDFWKAMREQTTKIKRTWEQK